MIETDIMTDHQAAMTETMMTGDMIPMDLLLHPMGRDQGKGLQVPTREIQDQEESTDLAAENMTEDINSFRHDFEIPITVEQMCFNSSRISQYDETNKCGLCRFVYSIFNSSI